MERWAGPIWPNPLARSSHPENRVRRNKRYSLGRRFGEKGPALAYVSGTEGYAEAVARFTSAAEGVSFAKLHAKVLHLMPPPPCAVLDIGAATGRDAAQFAGMGHRVVAVEPVEALRSKAAELHTSQQIEWLD